MNVRIEDFVGIYENAFPKEFCDKVIAYFEDADKAGLTLSRREQDGISALKKDDVQLYGHDEHNLHNTTTLLGEFNNIFWGQVYPNYVTNFEVIEGADKHTNYTFKIQKTRIGAGYHMWHHEDSSRGTCQRVLVWLVYLNDVHEGGETEFLYYPKRIKPKTGTMLLWPAGFTHTHRGNPPISNTKYIITGWIEY